MFRVQVFNHDDMIKTEAIWIYVYVFQHLDTSKKEIQPEVLVMKELRQGLSSTKKDQHNITGCPIWPWVVELQAKQKRYRQLRGGLMMTMTLVVVVVVVVVVVMILHVVAEVVHESWWDFGCW